MDDLKISDILLHLGRTWAFMALAALLLYLVVVAIENRPPVRIHIHGYHVPVEHDDPIEEETPLPVGKEES